MVFRSIGPFDVVIRTHIHTHTPANVEAVYRTSLETQRKKNKRKRNRQLQLNYNTPPISATTATANTSACAAHRAWRINLLHHHHHFRHYSTFLTINRHFIIHVIALKRIVKIKKPEASSDHWQSKQIAFAGLPWMKYNNYGRTYDGFGYFILTTCCRHLIFFSLRHHRYLDRCRRHNLLLLQ